MEDASWAACYSCQSFGRRENILQVTRQLLMHRPVTLAPLLTTMAPSAYHYEYQRFEKRNKHVLS